MRHTNHTFQILVCSLIISTGTLFADVRLQVRDGRPIVNSVYVDGHGPYRFLIDTGSNVNLIETGIAKKIGMIATFQVELATASGTVMAPGSDGNEITLESATAGEQKFLFSGLDAVHNSSPDVQGVIGEWFLCRFDYTLDLEGKRLEFGRRETSGPRSAFKVVNARPLVPTSLGDLALDSAADRLTLFGVGPDSSSSSKSTLRTLAGSHQIGLVSGKTLVIEGRKIYGGDAVAIPGRPEAGVDGLLPLGLFKTIYVSNSEGFVVFE
jgi:hypothetical protein